MTALALVGGILAIAQGEATAADTPPTPPTSVNPPSGGNRTFGNVQLSASGATDAQGSVTYQFVLGMFDKNFVERVFWTSAWTAPFIGSTAAVTVPNEYLRQGQQYYWKVRSRDSIGQTSGWLYQQLFVFTTHNPGAPSANYYQQVNLAPYGVGAARRWVNNGLQVPDATYLNTWVAPLAAPNPPTAACQQPSSLLALISQFSFAPDMPRDNLSPTGLANGYVKGLHPVASGVVAIMNEVKVKEPQLYNLLLLEGGWCYRSVKPGGGSPVPGTISNHSWGSAFDIRLRGAGYEGGSNSVVTEGLLRLYWYFNKAGYTWGYGYGTQDSMHFEASVGLLDYLRFFGILRHA